MHEHSAQYKLATSALEALSLTHQYSKDSEAVAREFGAEPEDCLLLLPSLCYRTLLAGREDAVYYRRNGDLWMYKKIELNVLAQWRSEIAWEARDRSPRCQRRSHARPSSQGLRRLAQSQTLAPILKTHVEGILAATPPVLDISGDVRLAFVCLDERPALLRAPLA